MDPLRNGSIFKYKLFAQPGHGGSKPAPRTQQISLQSAAPQPANPLSSGRLVSESFEMLYRQTPLPAGLFTSRGLPVPPSFAAPAPPARSSASTASPAQRPSESPLYFTESPPAASTPAPRPDSSRFSMSSPQGSQAMQASSSVVSSEEEQPARTPPRVVLPTPPVQSAQQQQASARSMSAGLPPAPTPSAAPSAAPAAAGSSSSRIRQHSITSTPVAQVSEDIAPMDVEEMEQQAEAVSPVRTPARPSASSAMATPSTSKPTAATITADAPRPASPLAPASGRMRGIGRAGGGDSLIMLLSSSIQEQAAATAAKITSPTAPVAPSPAVRQPSALKAKPIAHPDLAASAPSRGRAKGPSLLMSVLSSPDTIPAKLLEHEESGFLAKRKRAGGLLTMTSTESSEEEDEEDEPVIMKGKRVPKPTAKAKGAAAAGKGRPQAAASSSSSGARNALAAALNNTPTKREWTAAEDIVLYSCHGKGDVRNPNFWKDIATEMGKRGFQRTADECQEKWFISLQAVEKRRNKNQEKAKEKKKQKESMVAKEKLTLLAAQSRPGALRQQADNEEKAKKPRITKNDWQILQREASKAKKDDDIFDRINLSSPNKLSLPQALSSLVVPNTPIDTSVSPVASSLPAEDDMAAVPYFQSNRRHPIKRITPTTLLSYDSQTVSSKLAAGGGKGKAAHPLTSGNGAGGSSWRNKSQATVAGLQRQLDQAMRKLPTKGSDEEEDEDVDMDDESTFAEEDQDN